MKKLMIAAVVVMAAVASQAATFSWSTSGKAYGLKATDLTAGLKYNTTYDAGSTTAEQMSNEKTSYSATWTYTLMLVDQADATKSATFTGDIGTKYSMGRISNISMSDDIVVAGHTYNYTLVLKGDLQDGKKNPYTVNSDAITGEWQAQNIGDIKLTTAAATTWTTTPEPTSGLLLLLGVAGLALKRKQK